MKTPKFVIWDAGCGMYEIAKYSNTIQWHNGPDVEYADNYTEALHIKEKNENSAYRFINCEDLYNYPGCGI
jgi:hypothetical protein